MIDRSPLKPPSPVPEHDKDPDQQSETGKSATPERAVSEHAEEPVNPPLPNEDVPPLPNEPPPLPNEKPPSEPVDDGWQPVWDDHAQAYYFYNRFTNATQWENPRLPAGEGPPGVGNHERIADKKPPATGGYNPAIHGDYDPNADYAQEEAVEAQVAAAPGQTADPAAAYSATGAFNRFTGKWQNADFTPERFSDEAKSRRQMNAFFDVDAAANSHDGRSLRAERANKKLSKTELKAFKDKRREKKEEKRRAWLRD